MKTIEERAREYSLRDFDGYYTGREKAMEEAYIAGARDQKAVDDAEKHYKQGYHDAVEKACNWLKKELRKLTMNEIKDNFLENEFKVVLSFQVSDWLTDFRKAMKK